MEKLADLLEKRAKIVDRMKAAHEADKNDEFTAAETELRTLDEKIERAKKMDAIDRADPGTPISGNGELAREIRSNFSLSRLIASQLDRGVDAGFEREVQAELATRAGKAAQGLYVPMEIFERRASTSANAGGVIGDDHRPDQYINALAAASVVRKLGATVLTGLVGNVSIPRESGAPAIGWVAENSALPEGDAEFDSVTLSPKHAGALAQWSRNLVMQSSPQVEQLLRNMLARDLALAIDRAAVTGGGANEPTGILATAGVQDQAWDTDYIVTAAEMIGKADIANVDAARAFLSTPGVKKALLKVKDADGHPIPIAAQLHNEMAEFSTLLPSDLGAEDNEHGLIYGDWAQLVIGMWSEVDILVNPYESAAYSKGGVSIRAMATVDVALRHDEAFVQASGVIPA